MENQTENNWERLPLREAYRFGTEKGLTDEISTIRNMDIEWDLSYSSSLRRGYIIELFQKSGIWDEFIATSWPNGNTPDGERKTRTYLKIKERYEDFLASGGQIVTQEEEEGFTADQEFAYETDLRDYLARNLQVIERGLTLYEDSVSKGIEYPLSIGGRIDILAKDKDGRFAVIELKVSRGRNATVGQLLYYMGWVDTNFPSKEKSRGIIIAKEISEDLKLACQRVSDMSLYQYALSVATTKVYPV
jgi:hypothetical protein